MNKNIKENSVWLVLYIYWAGLLLWQNVRNVGNRGGLDTLVKAGLIFVLLFVFIIKAKTINLPKTVAISFYAILTIVTAIIGGSSSISEYIYYFFPIFLCFCVFALGDELTINKKQLFHFMNAVIVTVWYIVLYALVFCTDQFRNAFALTTAYGNELSSFLTSNYEYGLYLSFGMFFSIICLDIYKPRVNLKIFYTITLVVFSLNLILTYSRTCILAFLMIVVIYLLFARKGKSRTIILSLLVFAVGVYLCSNTVNRFVDDIVFKGNVNSGRSDLVNLGIDMFRSSSLFEQLFGMEYAKFTNFVFIHTSHSSLHNSYIQTLVTGGIKGLAFLFVVLVFAFLKPVRIIRTMKNEGKYKSLMVLFVAFVVGAMIYMLTTTGSLFSSSIDSYFLTVCAIIVPKYVCNSIIAGTFDSNE